MLTMAKEQEQTFVFVTCSFFMSKSFAARFLAAGLLSTNDLSSGLVTSVSVTSSGNESLLLSSFINIANQSLANYKNTGSMRCIWAVYWINLTY